MKKFMMTVSDEMWEELEKERTAHRYGSIQEVIRHLLATHFRQMSPVS